MSNIRDGARLAGVSVATVSRALSNPEKVSAESLDKVHTAIAQVGYRPNMLARNFRSARAYAVVVLVPDIASQAVVAERQAIDALMEALVVAERSEDAATIEAATQALAKGTEAFAAMRMNRGIAQALSGKNVESL